MSFTRDSNELVDRDFDFCRPYLFESPGKSKLWLMFLVRVTEKGFNFFIPENKRLLLSSHLYDRRFSGKNIPKDLQSLKTLMIWDHSVRIKPVSNPLDYWPKDVVWRPNFEMGFCCVEVTKGEYDARDSGDRYTCPSVKKKSIYPIGIVRDKCVTENGKYYFLVQFGGTPEGNVFYRTKHDPKKTKKVEPMPVNEKDQFGDRMKLYEGMEAQRRLMPRLPVVIRLDGKCFSKFTKGLKRPYDERMSRLMVETTKALVAETNALMGYTQSDEISLVLYSDSEKSQIYYDGRIQKMVGDLAAFATGVFNRLLPFYIPEKVSSDPLVFPRFDCRVWNVPDKVEAVNSILWREQDATKNSISMAARSVYSHKQVDGKKGCEKQEMLFAKGINWNDYPAFFKRGSFIQKRVVKKKFTTEEMKKLPPKHEARVNPDLTVERTVIEEVDMPKFSSVLNRVEVVFEGATPIVEDS